MTTRGGRSVGRPVVPGAVRAGARHPTTQADAGRTSDFQNGEEVTTGGGLQGWGGGLYSYPQFILS